MEIMICPVAKPRMAQSDRWKKRKCVTKYWGYKDHLKDKKINLPIPCKVTFYIPFPESYGKRKREELNNQPHTQVPDVDNFLKGFLDAIFEDDKSVWSIWAEKRWRDRGGIRIESISSVPGGA